MVPKALRRLALGAGLALGICSAPAMAKADPVSAFILTTAGFAATSGAIAATTSFLINVALFAVSTLATKVFGPKQRAQERQASITQLSLGETPPVVIYGTAVTGLSFVGAFDQ